MFTGSRIVVSEVIWRFNNCQPRNDKSQSEGHYKCWPRKCGGSHAELRAPINASQGMMWVTMKAGQEEMSITVRVSQGK
jgi:hypothetical protein